MSLNPKKQAEKRRRCTDKNRYSDETTARAFGQLQGQRIKTNLYLYHCKDCQGWHLTKQFNGLQNWVFYGHTPGAVKKDKELIHEPN